LNRINFEYIHFRSNIQYNFNVCSNQYVYLLTYRYLFSLYFIIKSICLLLMTICHSSSLTCNVTRTQSATDIIFFTALRQYWLVPRCQSTPGCMAALFISIGRMPFLAPTLDNANPLVSVVITPGFYLHHVEVTDQNPASGSL